MSELKIPESWAETTLGMVSDFKNGRSFKSTEWTKSGLPIIRIQNVNAAEPSVTEFNYFKGEFDQSIFVQTGDLLFCWSGSLGTSFGPRIWMGPSGVLNQHIFKVTLRDCIEKRFYFWQMKANLHLVEQRAHGGVGLTHITKSELIKVPFLIPPLDEQKRIVAKIESTQEKVKMIESSISQAEELIEKYRESLLQKAFRGELVPQDPNDEPASKLIERIQAEKAKRSDYKKKKKDELPPIKSEEIPFEIPKSWEWVRLGDHVTVKGGKRVPKGMSLVDEKTPYPYIRVADMKNHGVRTENIKYLPQNVYDQIKNYTISKDDLYITVAGTIGDVGIIPDQLDGSNLTENADKLTDFQSIFDQKYLLYMLASFFVQEQIKSFTKQVAQPKLSVENINKLIIAVPPILEQKRIALFVEDSRGHMNKISELLIEQLSKVNQLNSSILSNAFSGNLVPQISSEGTGHELLENIKYEQPSAGEKKVTKKTTASVKKKRTKK